MKPTLDEGLSALLRAFEDGVRKLVHREAPASEKTTEGERARLYGEKPCPVCGDHFESNEAFQNKPEAEREQSARLIELLIRLLDTEVIERGSVAGYHIEQEIARYEASRGND